MGRATALRQRQSQAVLGEGPAIRRRQRAHAQLQHPRARAARRPGTQRGRRDGPARVDQAGDGQVMGFVEFNEGHRYADFVPGTDKVAEYGIAALIAGGVAAKAGLFKVLLAALDGLNELLVVALAAGAAFFRELFRRKPADAAAP